MKVKKVLRSGFTTWTRNLLGTLVILLVIAGLLVPFNGTVWATEPPPEPVVDTPAEDEPVPENIEGSATEDIENPATEDTPATEPDETPETVHDSPKPHLAFAPAPANGTPHNYTVNSAADLRAAFADINNTAVVRPGDTVNITLTSDIYMGENNIAPDRGGDGIADPLRIGYLVNDVTINILSDGTPRTIYRVDHERHIYIDGANINNNIKNITLTFSGVTLDGMQTYNPMDAVKGTDYASSMGGITVRYAENIIIRGAHIQNCFNETLNSPTDGSVVNGGGLGLWYVVNVLLENSTIENNISGCLGGGISLTHGSLTVRGSTISNNQALRPWDGARGGGIYVYGGDFLPTSLTIENSTVENNSAKSVHNPNYISGITKPSTSTAADLGGGVCVELYASLSITGTTISGNTAHIGGGILFGGSSGETLRIHNTTISGNRAFNDVDLVASLGESYSINSAYGGGIYMQRADAVISGTTKIIDNEALGTKNISMGGGIFASSGTNLTLSGDLLIGNNSADGSASAGQGGGMYLGSSTLTVTGNVVFDGNTAYNGGGAYLSLNSSYSASFNGTVFKNNKSVFNGTSYGNGGAIYINAHDKVSCTNVTFTGNHAARGGFYLEATATLSQSAVDTYIATHTANITGLKSLTSPFEFGYPGEYAYNNYDIYLPGGGGFPNITVEYYKESVSSGNRIQSESVGPVGRRTVPQTAITAANINSSGTAWLDAYRPSGYQSGQLVSSLPAVCGTDDLVVQVLYPVGQGSYTVIFDTDGGTIIPAQTVAADALVERPSNPTKSGFAFAGWYDSNAFTTSWDFTSRRVNSNLTIYAKWTPVTPPVSTTHTVTYNGNGHTGGTVPATSTETAGATVTVPSSQPTRTGYTFTGWKASFNNTLYQSGGSFSMPAQDITMTAQWRSNADPVTYTVSFDSQGGSAVSSITGVQPNATIKAPATPARTNYTFLGWYTNPAGTTKWNFSTDRVTGNMTLYAKWEANSTPPAPEETTPPPDEDSIMPGDSSTPLFGGGEGKNWALANLILCAGSVIFAVFSIIGFFRKNRDDDEDSGTTRHVATRVVSILSALSSAVLFLLTQDLSLPMAIFDRWTLLMVAFPFVQTIMAVLNRRERDD